MWKNIVGTHLLLLHLLKPAINTCPQKPTLWWALSSRLKALTKFQQVGTHADSLIAEAVLKGVKGFDYDLAYEAVHKDATVAPENDNSTM